MTGVAFTVFVIKCTVTIIFFSSFWITRASANTDVLGRALEVRVNEVLL